MESDLVASFMEFTSCGSQATAVRHLATCSWRLEAAIDLYFAAGADSVRAPIPARSQTLYGDDDDDTYAADAVRAPIPARSETNYDDPSDDTVRAPIPAHSETLYADPYAASSSSIAPAAPSVWMTPYQSSVPPVHVQVPPLPEVKPTGSESDGGDHGKKEEINVSDDEEEENGMDANEDDGGAAEEQHSYYGTEAGEGSVKEQDGDYGYDDGMLSVDSDSDDGMEAAFGEQPPLPPPRAEKTLKELFRPPYELMYAGGFHDAKVHAARQDRWLLMNLQARDEFASHQHNRDLWANEVVAQVVRSSFVFSLVQRTREHGDEGSKVCCFYQLRDDQLPAVLVLDPITGQMLAMWSGAMHPDDFLTNIGRYTESKPSTLSKPKIVQRTETPEITTESAGAPAEQEPAVPKTAAADAQEPTPVPVPVPETDKIEAPAVMVDHDEQPMEGEKIYKLRVRSPSGNVVTKEFGCKRRVAVLFAYCRSVVREQAGTEHAFRIMKMVGRAFEELRDEDASFEDLGLNCATVSVVLNT